MPSLHPSASHLRSNVGALALTLACVACAASCDLLGLTPVDVDNEEDAECGNARGEPGEACDGDDLRGATCESEGFGAGALTCLATCDDFDRGGCAAPLSCGDDDVQSPEVCDGTDVGGATCESLGYGPGVLLCAGNCGNFDVSGCAPPDGCVPDCGAAVCGLDPVCGTSCGTCADGFACDDGACTIVPRCTEPGDITAACSGGACTLDLDVALLEVQTQVRVDGAAPIDFGAGYFETSVRFTDTTTHVGYSFGFDGTGGRERLLVPSGTYDVDLFVNDADAAPGAPIGTPLRAANNVAVTADRTLDVDIALFAVQAQVRVDATAPIDFGAGYFETSARFTDRSTRVAFSFGFDGTGGRETFLVPRGTYDVDLFVNDADAVPGAPPSTPLRAQAGVIVDADRTIDLDVALLDVGVLLAIDGTAPIDFGAGYFETSARFTDTTTHVSYAFGFDGTGGRETLRVPRGSYDVDLFVNDADAAPGAPTSTPLRAQAGVVIDADRTLDLDVALLEVAAQLDIDGRAPIDFGAGYFETSARFTDTTTHVSYAFGFDGTGGRETFLVPRGRYDVDLFVNDTDAVPGAPASTPLRARSGVAIDSDGTLDLDVPLFDVDALVRVDGAAAQDFGAGYMEVSARFTNVDTGVGYAYGFDGTGGRETFLVPFGTFDVDLFVNDADAVPGAPTSTPLRAESAIAIEADGPLDLDVALLEVGTTVRIDGTPPVDFGAGYFETSVRFTDARTGVAYHFGFDGTGGRETLLVPEGIFDVDLFVNDADAAAGAPGSTPLRATACVELAP